MAETAVREGWDTPRYLRQLVELEIEGRRVRKVELMLKTSHLPAAKTLSGLDTARLSEKVRRQLPALVQGRFHQLRLVGVGKTGGVALLLLGKGLLSGNAHHHR